MWHADFAKSYHLPLPPIMHHKISSNSDKLCFNISNHWGACAPYAPSGSATEHLAL